MKFFSLFLISFLSFSALHAMEDGEIVFEKYTILGSEKRKVLEQERCVENKSYVISKIKDLNTGIVSWVGEVSDLPPLGVWHNDLYSPKIMPQEDAKKMFCALKAAYKKQNN